MLRELNRHSFFLVAGAGLVFTLVVTRRWPRLRVPAAVLLVAGLAAFFVTHRTGEPGPRLEEALASGKPVLVSVYSNY